MRDCSAYFWKFWYLRKSLGPKNKESNIYREIRLLNISDIPEIIN